MDYLDFELEIQPGTGADYPVAVVRSPAGEARVTMHFPFDQLALESRLDKLQIALLRSGGKRRAAPSAEERVVQDFGTALFEAAFVGDVRSRYDVSRERAAQEERGLRVKLRIQDPALAALPWEYLYDPQEGDYVCLSRGTPVIRYLDLPQRIQSLAVALPLRILGMIVSPADLPPLDVEQEKMRVERAVAGLVERGFVQVTWLAGQTWRDLQREMQGGPCHIFHFVGHGGFDNSRDEGFICLAGEDGRRQDLYATELGRLLHDHASLRLVLLNACEGARGGQDIFSSTAAILVRRGMPAVLAMQYAITDQAAVEFARALYEALSRGLPVDGAVGEARKAVSLQVANTVEWGAPVLYMRTPDGVLFDIADAPPRPAAAPTPPPAAAVPVTPAVAPSVAFQAAAQPVGEKISRASEPAPAAAAPSRPPRPWLRSAVFGVAGLVLLVVAFLAARGPLGLTPSAVPTPSPAPAATSAPAAPPAPSPRAAPASMPAPSLTRAPAVPPQFRVDGTVNVRAGPGTDYAVVAAVQPGQAFAITGKDPAGDWWQFSFQGQPLWVSSKVVTLNGDPGSVPTVVVTPPVVSRPSGATNRTVFGKVIDSLGEPVHQVVIAITQAGAAGVQATSDKNGSFQAEVPGGSGPTWSVSAEADCGSRVMDPVLCNPKGYFPSTYTANVTLPQSQPIVFVYEKATTLITGKITGGGDFVFAVAFRTDAAKTWAQALPATGEFELPASDGTWQLYAYRTRPDYSETTKRVTIEIAGGKAPDPIVLPAP